MADNPLNLTRREGFNSNDTDALLIVLSGPVAIIRKGRDTHGQQRYACRFRSSENRGVREYQRTWWLQRRYGITLEEYEALHAAQQGGCAICGRACSQYDNLSVDHDHISGAVRGLLCSDCNRGIGMFKDTPSLLRAAAEYIERLSQ